MAEKGAKILITRRAAASGLVLGAGALAATCAPARTNGDRPGAFQDAAAAERGAPSRATALTLERLEHLRALVGAPALAAAGEGTRGKDLNLAAGLRMRGKETPVGGDDVWHFGSITKSMTATLIARSVEAGLLAWDDTIFSRLGDLAPDMRDDYRALTLRHLLSHRAGLATETLNFGTIRLPMEERDPRDSRRLIARDALRNAPVEPAERTFHYSNTGYVVACAMLEAACGAPWEALLRRHVFEPLGMANAGFGAPKWPRTQDGDVGEPVGHASWISDSVTPHPPGSFYSDLPAAWGPAGRVHAPLADMVRYLNAHRDRTSLLRTETWDLLHTAPFGGDYAFGWQVRSEGLWHNGSNSLWYAEVLVDRRRGISAVSVCNDGRIEHVAPSVYAALMGVREAVA
ncbi:MAG: serine hydrolase domain-containing protein [Hyphomonadaceae bacterium]